MPLRFNETTRAFFARAAAAESGQTAADMRAVAQDPPDLEAAKRLAAASPYYNSLMRTTCVATRVEGGSADNALPQSARAVINCRIFPDDTAENVRAWLIQTLADPEISLTGGGGGPPSPASPMLPEVMGAIEQVAAQMWPGIPVLPVMDPWAGDSAQMRRAGILTFGASGVFSDDSGNEHGANERISIEAFHESIEYMYRLLKILAANPPAALQSEKTGCRLALLHDGIAEAGCSVKPLVVRGPSFRIAANPPALTGNGGSFVEFPERNSRTTWQGAKPI